MNEYYMVKELLLKLPKEERELLILELLVDEEISYTVLSQLYVKALEIAKEKALHREVAFTTCLRTSIAHKSKFKQSWWHSLAFELIKERTPDEWMNKYLPLKNEDTVKEVKKRLNI